MSTTNELTIQLPSAIYNQAVQLAAEKHRSVADFVAERVVQTFHTNDDEWLDQAMEREEHAYTNLHATLVESHLYQYVALKDGVVVDTDSDEMALFLRIETAYPDQIVLLRQVLPTLPTDIYVRSPRFEN